MYVLRKMKPHNEEPIIAKEKINKLSEVIDGSLYFITYRKPFTVSCVYYGSLLLSVVR